MSGSLGTFGPFDLLTRLGQGGMGEIWKARRRDAGGDAPLVVVKRVLAHLSDDREIVRMFQREARICARLNHPNIVRILDFGEVDGELYLEMEYVRGIDVIQVMRQFNRTGVPPGAAAYTVASIARALAYAHSLLDEHGRPLRLVHRDVTPSNVMLGFAGEVKLLDFGVAKALSEASESRTATGTLKGKFGYMSPEQVEGATATHATDQFSAGVILHEMLTGQRLFRGENDMQTIARVKATLVSPPSHHNAEVSRELDAICLRALEREPTRRFPDCTAFANALEEVVASVGWSPAENAVLMEHTEQARAHGAPGLALALDRTERGTARVHPPAATSTRWRWRASMLAATLVILGVAAVAYFRPPAKSPPVAPVSTPASTSAPPNAPTSMDSLPTPVAPRVTPPAPSPLATLDSRAVKVKAPGPRVAHGKAVRAPRPRAPTPASPTAPNTPAPTTTGKVRTGQVLDPFAR